MGRSARYAAMRVCGRFSGMLGRRCSWPDWRDLGTFGEDESDIFANECSGSKGEEPELGQFENVDSGICKVMPVGRFNGGRSLNDIDVGENASAAERFVPELGEGEGWG